MIYDEHRVVLTALGQYIVDPRADSSSRRSKAHMPELF